ncbi:MAG: thermonuclease family protein [Myxococcota bacterium]
MRWQSIALALAIASSNCAHGRKQGGASAGAGGLVVGGYALAPGGIEDGDTISVVGIEQSLRLLAIDTEETFKKEAERLAVDADWEGYLRRQRGDSPRPVKMGSPLGEEGKTWAVEFFKGVKTVRLERDHPKEILGRYGRLLVYVFVRRNGEWVNYNVECVRAGMSPYFMKYGYSRRFHDDFVAAQEEARAAGVGIWDPTKRHYPDYDERLTWWTERAETVRAFEVEAVGRDDFVVLTRSDALIRLEAAIDSEVTLLGGITKIKDNGGTVLVFLGRRHQEDFPIVFFARKIYEASTIEAYNKEYVRVRGKVSRYQNPRTGVDQLQIVVTSPEQIVTP